MAYGLELRRPNGTVSLTTRETIFRFVHIERVAGTFSGSFSVPEFDAVESGGVFTGSGFFYVQYILLEQVVGGNRVAEYGASILPTLFWNNTAKTMTVTPASIPSGWPNPRPDYDIIFLHFR